MSTTCKGNRKSNMIFGKPIPAFLLVNINKLAGNTKISKAIIPHAEIFESAGIQSPIPKITSAIPAKRFKVLGFGK